MLFRSDQGFQVQENFEQGKLPPNLHLCLYFRTRIHIKAALNLTCDHVDKVIVARKEQTQKGETAKKAILSLLEDLKKMASNLDLTRQVGKLQNELALANKEALIAKAREIPGPSDA